MERISGKEIYALVEDYKQYIPLRSDRYRLSYNLYNYAVGKGDPPDKVIRSSRIIISDISKSDFIELLYKDINIKFLA